MSWVLSPAPPDVLEELYNEGYKAAEEWISLKEEKEKERIAHDNGSIFNRS